MVGDPLAALTLSCRALRARGVPFALVGGLAVTVSAEVRFTRDVDLAVIVGADLEAERLRVDLRGSGFELAARLNDEAQRRLATQRLRTRDGILVALLGASSGIDAEIVQRATAVDIAGVGPVPVAAAEELLAMKVLSMTDRRLQDRIDARNLLLADPDLDLDRVREVLGLITGRGFDRGEPLLRELDAVLAELDG